jgi:DNA-binding CsgD family transcriptional regulator
MRLDPLRIIEAGYRWEASEEGWLRGLVDAASALDAGVGAYARVDVFNTDRPQIRTMFAAGASERFLAGGRAAMEEGHASGPLEVNRALYANHPPVGYAREQLRGLPAPLQDGFAAMFASFGVEDMLGIFARDCGGLLMHIGVPMPKRRRLHPRTKHRLTCVAAHLTSAVRLRAAGAPSPEADSTDAVLEPSGVLRHAGEGAQPRDVRERLSGAVKKLERARGPLRRSAPDESLAIWRGLLDGRWSLIDHWDADGRRFVLARRNAPAVRDVRALTEAEGAVVAFLAMGYAEKYVAYLLGLSPSTVATQFASARRKLGVRSRQELIALLSARTTPR